MGAMEGSKLADDPFDFLSPDGPIVEEPAVTPPPAETPLPTEPLVEPIAEAPAEVPPVTPPPEVPPAVPPVVAPGHVPLAAVLDEREKRQAAERELAELRKQTAPVKQPTITDDPEGWQAAQDARFEKFRLDQTMEMSGRYAAQHYGEDKVQAAMAWGKEQATSDPYFGPKFTTQADPFGWLVEEHRRAQALGLLGTKAPNDWALEYAASQGWTKAASGEAPIPQQPAVATAPAQPTPPTAPPKSIAGATPAGGSNTPATLEEGEVGAFWSR